MLGVRVDDMKKEDLREMLTAFLFDGKQHTVFTPNPEMLVMATRDKTFQELLNGSDVNVADGFGLVLASKFLHGKWIERITGVETLQMLADICTTEGKKLMLLGGDPGVAEKAAVRLHACSLEAGVIGRSGEGWQMDSRLLERIRDEAPDALVVALGHGKQEKWIREFLPELPSVKIAIGVGGALDYLAGTVHRAPHLMQKFGLEWLFRLFHEPRRLPRIWTAVVVFPWLVIRAKMRGV